VHPSTISLPSILRKETQNHQAEEFEVWNSSTAFGPPCTAKNLCKKHITGIA
jgi:hypothetical protein